MPGRSSAAVDGYEAGCDWDVSRYSSWREVLADRASWPRGGGSKEYDEAFARGVRAALSDRAAGTVDSDAPGPGARTPYYRRRNPDSALTLAEAGLIQDVLLLGIGAGLAAVVGYVLWQKYGLNSDQTPEQAADEVTGAPGQYPPGTIPNPSVFSDQNPLAPWLPIGPAA